ncbi:HYD1 signature containing ADP-ribosyltransferase family protein [Pseudomonas extremaustralis]|uniref:HYD1 signature containing ADP-ribosyltransferase family protein n=1 Tax=Pseudomonas extremaustralis TaxID=359110 RepID=UPI0030B88C63
MAAPINKRRGLDGNDLCGERAYLIATTASRQENTVSVRPYTSRTGSKGIEKEGVILAQDNNRVYLKPAKSKALSLIKAQDKYQINKSKGRDYIETDESESRLAWIKSPRYNTMELTVKENLKLKNPKFTKIE